jgi:hypothetical protein
MLDLFKENMKKEIDIKILQAKEAWDKLSHEKITDGGSNS